MALTVGLDSLGTPEDEWRESGWIEGLVAWAGPRPWSVVVVAPHPDDEVLGVGGLMQHLAEAGAAVEIVAVTDGEASHPGSTAVGPGQLAVWRRHERGVAMARLGLADVALARAGLADGQVHDAVDELAGMLAARLQPGALCLAPWRHDGHPDHDASGEAARMASEAVGAQLVEYLVWAWHWATPAGGQIPAGRARRMALSERQRSRKSWSIAAFKSQLDRLGPSPLDGPVLPAPIVRRFRRPSEVVLV